MWEVRTAGPRLSVNRGVNVYCHLPYMFESIVQACDKILESLSTRPT